MTKLHRKIKIVVAVTLAFVMTLGFAQMELLANDRLDAPGNVLIDNNAGPLGARTVLWDAVPGAEGYMVILFQTQADAEADENRAAWLSVDADVLSVNLKTVGPWEGRRIRDAATQALFAQLTFLERTGHDGFTNAGDDVSHNLVQPHSNLVPGTYFVRVQALGATEAANSQLSELGIGGPENFDFGGESWRGIITSLPMPMGPWEARRMVEEFITNFGVEALTDPTLIPDFIAPTPENNFYGDERELRLPYILPAANIVNGAIRFWNDPAEYTWGLGFPPNEAHPDSPMTDEAVREKFPNRNATILAL